LQLTSTRTPLWPYVSSLPAAIFVPDVIIGVDVSSNTLVSNLGVSGYIGQNIQINGTLIVDASSFFFWNCRVRIAPEGRIVIWTGRQLSGLQSDFFACEQMWKGVVLLGSAKLFLLNCQIEDAQYAVHVRGAAELSLAGNTLNRNHKGIFIDPSQPLLPNAVNVIAFENNTFTCTAPLNAPYTGQPDPGAVSYAGIDAANCSITLGSENFTNTFTLMKRGITAKNAIVGVRNCLFLEMEDHPGDGDSFGIYAENGTLIVTGGRPLSSLFRNCGDYGIYTLGTNLGVERCEFRAFNRTGIFSGHNLTGQQINISTNRIYMEDNCVTGIEIERPMAFPGAQCDVFNNTISIDNTFNAIAGINVINPVGISAGHTVWITNNTIHIVTMADRLVGIQAEGNLAGNFKILHNKVFFSTADTQGGDWGIGLQLAFEGGNEITQNIVEGPVGPPYKSYCAVHVGRSPNTQLCGNSVNGTYHGFHFVSNNLQSNFASNIIGSHSIGLQIDGDGNDAGIGEQDRKHNTWIAPPWGYAEWAARCQTSSPGASRFLVEENDPSLIPVPRDPPGEEWFKVDEGDIDWCFASRPAEPFGPVEVGLLSGSLSLPPIKDWEYKFRLMRKLLLQPDVQLSGTSASDFLDAHANTTAGRLALAEVMMLQALLLPDTIQQALSSLHENASTLTDSIFIIEDALSPLGQDTVFNEALAAAKGPLLEQLETLRLQEQQIKASLNAVRLPLLLYASAYNATIPVSALWELNRRTLNEYLIQRAISTNGAAIGDALVESLALQDPDVAGEAVYIFRSFVRNPVLKALWGDVHHPAVSPPMLFSAERTDALRVWPNPASITASFAPVPANCVPFL
jgi:hypothetical protein